MAHVQEIIVAMETRGLGKENDPVRRVTQYWSKEGELLTEVDPCKHLSVVELADELDRADRMGADNDKPEGSRYIHMSDTLAKQIAAKLREIAG